jgi:glycosyltransferase involved in cell wall biosynthesis
VTPRRRLLIVGRAADGTSGPKLDRLAEEVELRLLPFRTRSGRGLVDYAVLPGRVARVLREFEPDAVLVQGAHETAAALAGRRLARSRAKVILDVHGDWRAPGRLYGSQLRRVVAPAADLLAAAALRRADAVRSITPYTTRLLRERGIEPADEFPAFVDLEPFSGPLAPLPEAPRALFVGALERTKGIDVLVEAWRQVPHGSLRVVGSGRLEPLVRGGDWTPRLEPAEVARALDESWCLVLPSRSEGMGRVVVEALCRGRAVVASRVGGIPDLVEDGVNGLLVEPGDAAALAAALTRVLSDRALAERLGAAAGASADRFRVSADEFARRLRDLVERVVH